MTPEAIRRDIETIAQKELRTDEPLVGGVVLAEHLDSIRRLSLVVAIEDHFEICFEPEDDEAAVTLDDVVRIVTERLAADPADA